jgi:hypothetical protein
MRRIGGFSTDTFVDPAAHIDREGGGVVKIPTTREFFPKPSIYERSDWTAGEAANPHVLLAEVIRVHSQKLSP